MVVVVGEVVVVVGVVVVVVGVVIVVVVGCSCGGCSWGSGCCGG